MDQSFDSTSSNMSQTQMPSEICNFGEFTQGIDTTNRFSPIDLEYQQGNQDGGRNTNSNETEFVEVRHKKRQRQNTNGDHGAPRWGSNTDTLPDSLKHLYVDDKLNVVLSKMASNETNLAHIKGKLDTVLAVNMRVDDLELEASFRSQKLMPPSHTTAL